jgi:mono/diheme cytochrome c family protein
MVGNESEAVGKSNAVSQRTTGRMRAMGLVCGVLLAYGASIETASGAAQAASGPATAAKTTPPASGQTASAQTTSSGSLVKRGEYVARAADCNSCHTAPGGKPFAGGYALQSAFGTIYGTNITPDAKTGIGTWTKADFERALRRGIRKDGDYLYPAMPYTSYTKMTASDMNALWAYMRSLPPVNNTIPKNTLPFPLTIRSGMAVWQSLYFKPGPFTPTPGKDAVWNRGAYLVEALAHCNDCHTPRNLAQATESSHVLAGAQIEGWYAPDISNDAMSKLAYWNVGDLAKFLKTGGAPDNTKTFGPMQEVVHDSLQYLTDADLHAIAVYLKDQSTNAQPVKPTKAYLPGIAAGKLVYENNCSSCHQSNGKGIPSTVPALAGNDSVTAGEPYNVIMAMLEGFAPQGSWGAMGSFAKTLSDDQIADVANYVRTAWGNNAPANATPWSVGNWRKNATTAAVGSSAMLCPNLADDVIAPALQDTPDALKQAASDHSKMSALVGKYRASRPGSSKAQVIEALSTAYCRAVTTEHISEARMSGQIADFAQAVAVALAAPAAT